MNQTTTSFSLGWIIGWILFFLVVGAIWYVFDRRLGTKFYRIWYNWTHKDQLADNINKGFIFAQPAKTKFAWATGFALIESILLVWSGRISPFNQLIAFVAQTPILMIGFYLGPLLDRLWTRKNVVLDKIDEVESGKTTFSEVAKEAMDAAGKKAKEAMTAVRENLATEDSPKPASQSPDDWPLDKHEKTDDPILPRKSEKSEESPEPTAEELREKLKKFTQGG